MGNIRSSHERRRWSALLGMAATVAAVLVSGCASRTEASVAETDPVILHLGDSISMSSSWMRGAEWRRRLPDGVDYELQAFMGTKVSDHLGKAEEFMAEHTPRVFVIQLGSNDALDGWGDEGRRDYRALLEEAPEETCVLGVLPFLVDDPDGPRRPETHSSFDRARSDITEMVSSRPVHRVADMADFAAENPEMMSTDGLHLAVRAGKDPDHEGIKNAYRDWLFEHVAACGA